MSQSLKAMLFFILIFMFTFLLFDVNKNLGLKQDAYETIRASNQNALLDLEDKYNDYEELNTPAMLEQWLVNFINNNNIKWEDIEIEFIQLETDPPLYLVGIEGYKESYTIVNKRTYIRFHNGSTIISKESEDDD